MPMALILSNLTLGLALSYKNLRVIIGCSWLWRHPPARFFHRSTNIWQVSVFQNNIRNLTSESKHL